KLSARFFDSLRKALAQFLQTGNVGLVKLGHVGNRRPGVAHVLRGLTSHVGHGLALDLSPAGEIGKRSRYRAGGRGRCPADDLASVLGDVAHRNSTPWP